MGLNERPLLGNGAVEAKRKGMGTGLGDGAGRPMPFGTLRRKKCNG